jgi:hypothetical protein
MHGTSLSRQSRYDKPKFIAPQWPNILASCEAAHRCDLAKRLECAEPAPAFGFGRWLESAGKPDALQTLRAVPFRFSPLRMILPCHDAIPWLCKPDFCIGKRLNKNLRLPQTALFSAMP